MNPELEYRLYNSTQEQLVLLIQELAARHPVLLTELADILDQLTAIPQAENESEIDNEVTEDWDFGSNEAVRLHTIPQTVPGLLDLAAYRQRIAHYTARLNQDEPAQVISDDLMGLLEEAEIRANHDDYHSALDLYALVFDTYLAEQNPALTSIFEKAIGEAVLVLETLLSVASSNVVHESSTTFLPLLTPVLRRRWLERLFALWLKRLDEHMPEIILAVAWHDDLPMMHTLVQDELLRLHHAEHSNIVDFTHQYRARILEKFLKDLLHRL